MTPQKQTVFNLWMCICVLALVHLTTAEHGCGSIVNNTLKSPGYPSSYPNNMDCVYQVPIPRGMGLNIYFKYFYLEDDPHCRFDYLNIANENKTINGTYCGQETGKSVLVTGRYAVISLYTDGSYQYTGYELLFHHVTLICSERLDQSFGRLFIEYSGKFMLNPYCNWTIENGGSAQDVAIVSIHYMRLRSCSEYVKVFDGIGREVLARNGCVPTFKNDMLFREVPFGDSKNVLIEVSLVHSRSFVYIDYGILKKGVDSAVQLDDWITSVGKTTEYTVKICWPLILKNASHYIVFLKTTSGDVLEVNIVSGNTACHVFYRLSLYTEYRLSVVGVDDGGTAYKSPEVAARTNEGVPGIAPSNISITNTGSTQFTVNWDPISRKYYNGRLLGYRVYFQKFERYYCNGPAESWSSVDVPNLDTRLTLTGLKPGQCYRVSVCAFTEIGEGARRYIQHKTLEPIRPTTKKKKENSVGRTSAFCLLLFSTLVFQLLLWTQDGF